MPSADGRVAFGADDVPDGSAVALLAATLRTLRRAPEVVVVYLFAALVAALPTAMGDLLASLASVLAVAALVESAYVRKTGSNSMGVRFLLAYIAALAAGVVVLVGLLMLVLPGLYALVRFYLVIPAVLVDDYGPIEAMQTSWRRTEGRVLEVGGVVSCIFLASFAVAAAVLLAAAGGVDPAVARLASGDTLLAETAASLVNGPLVAASSTLLYLRTRE